MCCERVVAAEASELCDISRCVERSDVSAVLRDSVQRCCATVHPAPPVLSPLPGGGDERHGCTETREEEDNDRKRSARFFFFSSQ